MPTKLRRVLPRRIGQTPLWAQRLLQGELPPIYSDDHASFIGWRFFGEETPGFPPADSDEGHALLRSAQKNFSRWDEPHAD